MAEDTVDMLAQRDGGHRPCRTRTLPLASAEDLGAAQQALARSGLSNAVQQHLLAAYGPAATDVAAIAGGDPAGRVPLVEDLPVLAAEVVYACRHEMALTLADMMFVRTNYDSGKHGRLWSMENVPLCVPCEAQLFHNQKTSTISTRSSTPTTSA